MAAELETLLCVLAHVEGRKRQMFGLLVTNAAEDVGQSKFHAWSRTRMYRQDDDVAV